MDIVTKSILTSPWLARSGKLFAVVAAYFLLGWIGYFTSMSSSSGAVLWLSDGLALAALLRFAPRHLPSMTCCAKRA